MSRSVRLSLTAALAAIALTAVWLSGMSAISFGASTPKDNSASRYHSPFCVAVADDEKVVYVSDRTADAIVRIDGPQDRADISRWPLPGEPTGIVLAGSRLYAALYERGEVVAVDTTSGKVMKRVSVGACPLSLTLGRKTRRLYVCCRASDSVSVIDTATFKQVKRIGVVREPYSAALTPDESTLLVANGLPRSRADAKTVSGVISVIDTAAAKVVATLPLCNGATNLRGIAVDPTGSWAYCVHTVSRFNLPTTQLDRGWMNTSGLSIIDLKSRRIEATVLLDSVDRGAADPWGIAVSPDGGRLYVALSGTHEVEIVELARLHARLRGELPKDLPQKDGDPSVEVWRRIEKNPAAKSELVNDLTALDCLALTRRMPSGGWNPRGIALSSGGTSLFVANYFSGDVSWFRTDSGKLRRVSLGSQRPEDSVRRGERVFHDASICYQTWQSCATCHPDGRSDGLRWDLLNDGMGNPKKTRSLVKSFSIHPVMSMGIRADAKTAVRAGFRFILFNDSAGTAPDAVDAWLKSLRPEPSPFRAASGKLTSAAARGRTIFFGKARCSSCHSGPLYTNLSLYSVVPSARFDKPDDTFVTPKLIEICRAAPYLHDGRAATLRELLTTFNQRDKHGLTSKLTNAELQDLIAFLNSL
jgi:YVTN family beta-propeller protein